MLINFVSTMVSCLNIFLLFLQLSWVNRYYQLSISAIFSTNYLLQTSNPNEEDQQIVRRVKMLFYLN